MTTKPKFESTYEAQTAVLDWATKAAQERVTRARFDGYKVIDTGVNPGLWQAFRDDFPRESLPGDYDLYVHLLDRCFTATVKAIVGAFEEEKASKKRRAASRAGSTSR